MSGLFTLSDAEVRGLLADLVDRTEGWQLIEVRAGGQTIRFELRRTENVKGYVR